MKMATPSLESRPSRRVRTTRIRQILRGPGTSRQDILGFGRQTSINQWE
jgi:hypothetical protein